MDKPVWMKFLGLSRLAMTSLWVGSTSAQSPPGRTLLAFSPFPWSWVLPGHLIPFWKAFDKPNNNVRADF